MNLKQAVVYWIRLPNHNDIYSEGYVGVTQNLTNRLNGHYRDIKNKNHKNTHLLNAVEKYGWDNLIKEAYISGEETFCYEQEETIRPSNKIGWNLAVGGHKGPGWPKGKKRDAEWLEAYNKSRQPIIEKRKKEREQKKEEYLMTKRTEKEKKMKLDEQKKLDKILRQETKKKEVEERQARKKLRLEERIKKQEMRLENIKSGGKVIRSKDSRPICKMCNDRPRAVSYIRANGTTQYRSLCDACLKLKKQNILPKPDIPQWRNSGYKKKTVCDSCKFTSRYSSQMLVVHIDGNENNNNIINLRTICLNCAEEQKRKPLFSQRIGGIEPDR